MSFTVRLDVDPVIICPYDDNHKIPRSRIQKHLVKCEKNFPPDYKQQCPYDATHRFFEHEMTDHVAECPMKLMYIHGTSSTHFGKLPEIDSEMESKIDYDEVWDEQSEAANTSDSYDRPTFESINVRQYTNIAPVRGNAVIAKRFNSTLRRPYGYSESMMLDISSKSIEDDLQSVTDDMGIGRGQGFLRSPRGQPVRGVNRGVYRKGIRGRLLHQ